MVQYAGKLKPSETLDALVCAQRLIASLGVSLSFTWTSTKRVIAVMAKRSRATSITNESATAYRRRCRQERKEDRCRVVVKKFEVADRELANFARLAANKYRDRTFDLSWLDGVVVRIEQTTGLLVTSSGKYLSESNCRRFYNALMAKEA